MRIKKTVYTKSFEDAVAANEADRWRESDKLNAECCEAINTAINVSRFDTNHYNLKNAAQDVIHRYGDKRVLWVLAATVQLSFNDGRYSRANKEWAEGFTIPLHNKRHPTVPSHPCLVDGFIDRAKEVSAELAAGVTAFAADEKDLFYAGDSNPERDERLGYIGRLRGDFGKSGREFWTTWMDGHADLKSKAFSRSFDDIVNTLRGSILRDYKSMEDYCKSHPEALLSEGRRHYGFKLNTRTHTYCINCCSVQGDYNFYIHAFNRSTLEKSRVEPKPSLLGKLEENKQKTAALPPSAPKKVKDLEV